MRYKEVFLQRQLLLPQTIPAGKSYHSFLNELFEEYINLLRSVSPAVIEPKRQKNNNLSSIIKIQEKFIEGLIGTINIYLDGQPATAYKKFVEVIESRKGTYRTILNVNKFDNDENFYRIRIKKENFPFSNLEMFHIPFHHRGKVASQRYSIPGFPSLYLSKTLYVAWEELNRPNLDNFQAARFVLKKSTSYLDLTTDKIDADNPDERAYRYLMTWPLIAACSIRVSNRDDAFKPEYIIPQLLLQWTRNSGTVDAIKYPSTRIDNESLKVQGDLYNVVFPVKLKDDEGYCNHLTGLFESTETISKQLLDYSVGGRVTLYSRKEHEKIDRKIPPIELIKGRKLSYSYSVLGWMELILDGMSTQIIL